MPNSLVRRSSASLQASSCRRKDEVSKWMHTEPLFTVQYLPKQSTGYCRHPWLPWIYPISLSNTQKPSTPSLSWSPLVLPALSDRSWTKAALCSETVESFQIFGIRKGQINICSKKGMRNISHSFPDSMFSVQIKRVWNLLLCCILNIPVVIWTLH